MPILNYTTDVPVERTINELQKILTKAKASAIMTEYDPTGLPCALSFQVTVGESSMHFRLPIDVKGVERALKLDKEYKNDGHTRRVAWRIAKDWCEAQMALIQAQMADLVQVFLPYAQTPNGDTVYQMFQKRGMPALTFQKKE